MVEYFQNLLYNLCIPADTVIQTNIAREILGLLSCFNIRNTNILHMESSFRRKYFF